MPRRILFAAFLMAIAANSNTNSFGLVFAPAADGLGLSVAALGGIRTLENAASIVVALLVAPLVDRFPRKYVLLAGFGSATTASLTLVISGSAAGAIVFFILNGASVILIFGALTAMPSDFETGRRLNRIMGLILGFVAFTSILISPTVGAVSDRLDWQAGMLVSTGVTTLAFLATLLLVPGYRSEQQQNSETESFVQRYRTILAQRPLLLMLGNNLLRFAQLLTMLTFASTVLIQRYDLSLGRIGLVFPAMGIAFFLSSFGSGMLLHLIKTRRVLVWGGAASAGLFVIVLILQVPIVVMLPCLVLLIGLLAAQIQTGTIAVLRLSPWARGAAMSWNELAAGAGSLLGIGLGSTGLAVAGISGLGVVMFTIAASGALVGYVALWYAGYRDEDDSLEPARPTGEYGAQYGRGFGESGDDTPPGRQRYTDTETVR